MRDAARYYRNPETGRYCRVAYRRVEIRYWVGGRGPVTRTRFKVWNPEHGSLEEQEARATAGERFALVLTKEQFEARTFPPEDLPPMDREVARRLIERAAAERPGETLACRFVKRTNGELRRMRFRYDPQSAGRCGFDPKAKGLLPVYDVERGAQRFINLDGVREVAGRSPALAWYHAREEAPALEVSQMGPN